MSGIVQLAVFLLARSVGLELFDQLAIDEFGPSSEVAASIGVSVVRSAVAGFMDRLWLEAGIAAALGLELIIASRFLR